MRDVTALSEGRVQHRTRMSLREDESVPVLPEGFVRAVAHDTEVEAGDDVRGREAPARMTRAGGGEHLYDEAADAPRARLDLFDVDHLRVHGSAPLSPKLPHATAIGD